MIRISTVLHILSFVILVIAGVMAIPWALSLAINDGASDGFFKAIGLTLLFGYVFWRYTRKRVVSPELKVRDGFLLVALTWMIAPLFACLPFMFQL